MHRNTTGWRSIDAREQETAVRRGVVAGQTAQLDLKRHWIEIRVEARQVLDMRPPMPRHELADQTAHCIKVVNAFGAGNMEHECLTNEKTDCWRKSPRMQRGPPVPRRPSGPRPLTIEISSDSCDGLTVPIALASLRRNAAA
jgi:hypothetical protein